MSRALPQQKNKHSTRFCKMDGHHSPGELVVTFEDWVKNREISTLGTNSGAPLVAFQTWRRFKEAFAPELIQRAIQESSIPVRTCLDPFGGSGTTALACQFLGVSPTTIEVNPYLADLIEAKLSSYDVNRLIDDLGKVVKNSYLLNLDADDYFKGIPKTFIEPGEGDRWILDLQVAKRLASIREAINRLSSDSHKRLFRALLGGVIVEASNVVVSGKGRRYRRNWKSIDRDPNALDLLFQESAARAIGEIYRYADRKELNFTLIRGDSREKIRSARRTDICIFSPPYPNSFDYTDVYNVELWAMGYLTNRDENLALRNETLSSHVQIFRKFSPAPKSSKSLNSALSKLIASRDLLWSKHIPEMIGGYFHDMNLIMEKVHQKLNKNGSMWMVVGDSRYAGAHIPVAKILMDLGENIGFSIKNVEPFRSMRVSPQQGGQPGLDETLLVLTKKGSSN